MPEKRCDIVKYYREWKRKHPNYPLTPHPSGQWAKKVRGKLYYFGRLSEPDEALKLWLEEKDYLLAGLEPPTYTDGITVEELCDRYLENAKNRIGVKFFSWGLSNHDKLLRRSGAFSSSH